VFILLLGAFGWFEYGRDAGPPEGFELEPIFRFEKEDMVGFVIARPDRRIEMRLEGDTWTAVGESWRPSRSMVRRVAHQLHDLTARATVVDQPEDYGRYGLGEGAIQVEIFLRDGRTLAFVAGDPNPTAVSYYLRPLPGERVYVVKKSAVDFYRSDIEAFREHKFATFDANDADTLVAEIDGGRMVLERTGTHSWQMSSPVTQRASRDKVRMMLGRVSAMKAQAFVEDGSASLERYGLEPAVARLTVRSSVHPPVTVWVGDAVPDSDPPQRYVYRVEDDAVYAVKDGFLDAYRLDIEAYRDPILIGKRAWDVVEMVVELDGAGVRVERGADDWRWPGGQAIAGSTPERVAGRAADARAAAFHDQVPADAELDPPWARVQLSFEDDSAATLNLGRPRAHASAEGEGTRHYARVEGDPTTYEVDGQLGSTIEDLHREYGRKLARDEEKDLDLAPDAAP